MDELCSLVERAKARDLDAFGQLVRRFQDMAYGCAHAILGDFHLAEDAAQEAFIAAYRRLGDLREPRAFPGWFRRIVLTQCNRLTRGERPAPFGSGAGADAASEEPGPPEIAQKREMADRVLEAVRSLPDNERMVTTLFYINGYSQKDIADFLEVPVTTVNNRLHASRKRLKGRMLAMVEETLKSKAPDERLSRKVIEELLGRPKPLEIEAHPVRQVWDAIRAALPDYEVVTGEEVVGKPAFVDLSADWEQAYRLSDEEALRTETTITTMEAMRDRTPPVRLLAAGRVFRPDKEDASHAKVFHQADGLCVEPGADADMLKSVVDEVLCAVLGPAELRWRDERYPVVEPGFEVDVLLRAEWLNVAGCGMFRADILREAGFDVDAVSGWAFGLGLERLAMLKFGIDDIRKLWQPPYLTG